MQVINIPIPQIPPLPPVPPLPPEIAFRTGPPEEVIIGIVFIIGIIVAGVIFAPLIKAFARRIEGKQVDANLTGEIEHLRSRVAELEGVEHRLAELEERVDFSERLLTQGREQPVIRGER